MRYQLKVLLYLVLILTLAILIACGDSQTSTTSSGDEDRSSHTSNADGASENNLRPTTIKLGSASQGGTYFIYAGGLANLIDEKLGVTTNVEVTGGPVHNIQLIHGGEIDLGMTTMGPAFEAYTGTADWTGGQVLDSIRIIFPMYTTPFKWWALESSGIQKISDIAGLRVGVGPAGGTSGTYYPIIHETLALNTDNVLIGANDMSSQMLDRQLDVIAFAAGTPISILTEIESQREVNIFGIEGEERRKVMELFPYFYEYTLPANSYASQANDIETVAMFNFGITHKEMDEDFIYDLVKAYHEHIDLMISTHASAQEALPEAILNNTTVPLHPGAIRYYEEIGIELPETVYPHD